MAAADEQVWTVGALARLAKVSVRTLHHCEEIGLLPPSGRSETGYRQYTRGDLERLQQVLAFRELGFPLKEILRIMLDPSFDRAEALRRQRTLLAEKAERTKAMAGAVDAALETLERGTAMDPDDMFEVFGDFDPAEYEEEARGRWGHTAAYAESARRTARYTKADWLRIKQESEAISQAFVEALDAGLDPAEPAVQTVVERHWRHLETYFYTPTPEMYAGLGDLYISDPRFTKNIDEAREGLAAYQCAAMQAYAAPRRQDG